MADDDKLKELDPAKIIEEMRQEYWDGISEPEDETDEERVQLLIARMGGENFSMEATLCRSITKAGHITRVPRMPAYMIGVINLRGRIIAVVDLLSLFNLGTGDIEDKKSRLVVVESEGTRMAFLVDHILGIDWIELGRIREPEGIKSRVKAEYIKGHVAPVTDEGWMTYLDVEKIIRGPELTF
jgi:purine-binding chemotaxis protein CheW